MEKKVQEVLNKIKPMLEADGGSIDLISVDEKKGIVKVKLVGACGACPFSMMTLKNVVERALKQEIPEIKEVVSA